QPGSRGTGPAMARRNARLITPPDLAPFARGSSPMRILTFVLALLMALPAVAAHKMTLLLDWYVNPDHGPIVIAKEKGFFADEGLDVEIVAPADPSAPPKLVA